MRFYKNIFPAKGDIVIAKYKEFVDKTGLYVTLLEYDNAEGFVSINEIGKLLGEIISEITNNPPSLLEIENSKGKILCEGLRISTFLYEVSICSRIREQFMTDMEKSKRLKLEN